MATYWPDVIREKAKRAIEAILLQEKDTPLNIIESLRIKGWSLRSEGETLKVTHQNAQEKLTDEQRGAIRKHKRLIQHFLTDKILYPDPQGGWQSEWRQERDLLLRRACCCWQESDRARLVALADSDPQNDEVFTQLWREIRELEAELDQRGELPPSDVL